MTARSRLLLRRLVVQRLSIDEELEKLAEKQLGATVRLPQATARRRGELLSQGLDGVVDHPGQPSVEADVGELQDEPAQVETVDVPDENGRKRRHVPRGIGKQRLAHQVGDFLELFTRNDVVVLLQMDGSETSQSVPQLGIVGACAGGKVARPHVEAPQDRQELFCGEGPVPALEVTQTTLRKLQLARQILLRQTPLSSQLADLSGDPESIFLQVFRRLRGNHISHQIKLSASR